jgi:hypothetical protein
MVEAQESLNLLSLAGRGLAISWRSRSRAVEEVTNMLVALASSSPCMSF